MTLRSVLAIPVVILGVVALWLNEPLPPNTANPIKYKIAAAFIKAFDDIAFIQSWLTGEDHRIVGTRHMRAFTELGHIDEPDILVSEEIFDGVPVYIYQPKKSGKNRPGLLYFHGGGFVTGHPVGYESLIYKFVRKLDMVVVAPDYRLSPQVRAPAAHDDCMKASRHFFANAEKYSVDPNKIGAGGDSAGGNLASSLALMLRDKGSQQFQYQLLFYPCVQILDVQTPSYQQNSPSVFRLMTHDTLVTFFASFLGVPLKNKGDILANRHVKPETWEKYRKYMNINEIPKESIPKYFKPIRPTDINQALADFMQDDIINPYLFPLLADDLSDLPPAYVLTIENDPIRDDGVWYANRLKREGNKVLHDHSVDGFHGMIGLQAEPIVFDSAVRATENTVSFIKDVMNNPKEVKREKRTINVGSNDDVKVKPAKAVKKQKSVDPVSPKTAPAPKEDNTDKISGDKKVAKQDVKMKKPREKSQAAETPKPTKARADKKQTVKKDPPQTKPSPPSQAENMKTNKDKKVKTSQAGAKVDAEKSGNKEKTKPKAKGNKSGEKKEAKSKNRDEV